MALSFTGAETRTAYWEEHPQVCEEIRLALAEVRRRTPLTGLRGAAGGRCSGPWSMGLRQALLLLLLLLQPHQPPVTTTTTTTSITANRGPNGQHQRVSGAVPIGPRFGLQFGTRLLRDTDLGHFHRHTSPADQRFTSTQPQMKCEQWQGIQRHCPANNDIPCPPHFPNAPSFSVLFAKFRGSRFFTERTLCVKTAAEQSLSPVIFACSSISQAVRDRYSVS